ncbi:UDP-glucuronic acid/UDP-N-acetylgalactosamine transporter [Trypanosoma conorhini]|uniref:UDP-glucuronic acid/UDP-N-acetylgalactosamine transporter n=1 Tax=Trypanosoma conorhini TaxID=83891 RepID=A0A3R7M6C8_9TRYP|nr:UDP-glucuronic acid/UDP-N-acetylgalactosamine transporter [Trypanosoma conorhini]RNF27404.1 UDP-glucuronic acid/UDP-N-acetylgalactosamine transporter [Trypanosoma conorhini]
MTGDSGGRALPLDAAAGARRDGASDFIAVDVCDAAPLGAEAQPAEGAWGGGGGGLREKDAALLEMTAGTAPRRLKLLAALLYAAMSVGIMMLTKTILTEFDFHCFMFVGFLQYAATTVVSLLRRRQGAVSFPLKGLVRIILVDLFPLPVVFVFNTLSGLGATQALNMPLFVLLRRLSIALTLLGEAVLLRYRHDWETRAAVALMIAGAVIATSLDVRAPLRGILFVLANDACTALNGVLTRRKMDEGRFSSAGIMFYTNAFAACFAGVLLLCDVRRERTALRRFDGWTPALLAALALNAVSGYGISYATYLCMRLNSPLTVSMIGAGKNVVTSYVGMIFSDYAFTVPSFVGVNVSVLGCIVYSHREFVRILRREEGDPAPPQQQQQQQQRPAKEEEEA